MEIKVKFYEQEISMILNEKDLAEDLSFLCHKAFKQMDIKIEITKVQIVIFKEPKILLYPKDKASKVLENGDTISIYINENVNLLSGSNSSYYFDNTEMDELDFNRNSKFVTLNGNDLKISELVLLGTGIFKIKLSNKTLDIIRESRKVVDDIAHESIVYGVNTGFGKFATTTIPDSQLEELQLNLIRSHSSGVGDLLPTNYVRMLMALRINVLAKGYSGVSIETLQCYLDAFNKSCLPAVPEQGSVGASGDLAPLSHIALGLLGEGKMWSPTTGMDDAINVLNTHGLKPLHLKAKEGLALINGTQFITALGAEAVERAKNLAIQADIIAALTTEMLKGNVTQMDPDIHEARPHNGQIEVAKRMRSILHSDVYESKCYIANKFDRKVQDPYTMRCIPQVHGVVIDIIKFCSGIIETEMNSATDNPMVLKDRKTLISGGNFHGEYPAKALDILAIGVHELANISERRIERLVNSHYSEGLPSFLVAKGGINSGFMIAHCTAAALTSENKVLCHPSSIDTLTTSGGTEDHVSMGPWSARKAIKVIKNVENILAIELLSACQALEFFHSNNLTTTEPLEAVYNKVREYIKPWKKDRYMSPDIDTAASLLRNNKILAVVKDYMIKYNEQKNESRNISCLFENY